MGMESMGTSRLNESFGEQFGGFEESEQFPGSKILTVKNGERYQRYALRRDEQGNLAGNSFELQEQVEGRWQNSADVMKENPRHRIGPVQQMRGRELEQMELYLKDKNLEI
jgi:hypothetical protein